MADPFTDMMEQLRDEILEGVCDIIGQLRVQPDASSSELDPFALYTAQEAADILGLDRATMYEIPETELPRCEIGPARGATRWMGADLLAYSRGLDPVDYQTVLSDLREELSSPHPEPSEDGMTRVI